MSVLGADSEHQPGPLESQQSHVEAEWQEVVLLQLVGTGAGDEPH